MYCPAELITYFAFDYNKYGVGKSLLEDGRTIATLRASMIYADIHAAIQNSIGRRKMVFTPDEADQQPLKSLETLRSEYIRINSWSLPLLSQGPIDAVNTLREANIDLQIEGDNPGLPNTRLDVEDTKTDRPRVEQEIMDYVRDLQINSFGIPPSVLDETKNIQFASSNLRAHMLLNKRVVTYQSVMNNDLLYDHVSKYTLNSGELIRRLALTIKENKDLLTDKQRNLGNAMPIIEDFLDCLTVALPVPDSGNMEDRKNDIDNYVNYVNTIVDSKYPDSVLEWSLPDDISDKSGIIKDLLKSISISRYLDENGFNISLDKLLDEENVDDTMASSIRSYLNPLSKAAVESILTFDTIRKTNADNALKGAIPDNASDGGDAYSGSDTSNDNTDDETSGDDLDFGMDEEESGTNEDESTGEDTGADEDLI